MMFAIPAFYFYFYFLKPLAEEGSRSS